MKNRLLMSVGGVLIALALLVGLNALAGVTLAGMRVDLTENKLYTLSDGSKRILANLEEPITLRFFRSKELANKYVAAYSQRVEELLVEYRNRSSGKITLEVLDPEPFSETEDQCVQYGIQAVPVPEGALYFGLGGSNSLGEDKAMPFLDPSKEEFLEYDLSKLVYTLANPSKPVLGVLSSLPIEGASANPFMRNAPQPWFIMDAIRELNYETRTIQPSVAEIPSDVTVLLVVHPKNVSESTQYAIDQFVLRGGKAIVFVDPWCEADEPVQDPNNPLQAMMQPRSSELPRLFEAWGVQSPTDKFVGDRKNATTVTFSNNGRPDQASFVAWIRLPPESLAEGEVTTADMSMPLFFKEPGFLEHREGATSTFTPLIQTSEDSMEIENSKIQFSANPGELLQNFFPSGRRMTIAARLGGKVKSAFPEGKPASAQPAEDAEAPSAHLAESQSEINVVVVADVDMLTDSTWVRVQNFGGLRIPSKLSENGTFVMNTLDFMQGSTDLISLRARGGSSHPFLVVEELKRDAEQRFRDEEGRLVAEKERVERELNDLISKKGDATEEVLMSAEVQAKVEDLRTTLVATQKRLREVRYNLNKDVEALGTRLKLLNIGLIPALTMVAALFVTVYRTSRRRAA